MPDCLPPACVISNTRISVSCRRIASVIAINPPAPNYTQEHLASLYRQLEDRLSQLPGVQSVSFALYSPMSGNNWGELIAVEGKGEPKASMEDAGSWDRVSTNYLTTIGQQVVRGRNFQRSDAAGAARSRSSTRPSRRSSWPAKIRSANTSAWMPRSSRSTYEIVGVARDAKYTDPVRPGASHVLCSAGAG